MSNIVDKNGRMSVEYCYRIEWMKWWGRWRW